MNLGASSQILARGDNATGGSSGGNVTLRSGDTFSDTAGSQIVTTGGGQGGNGGNIEISAPSVLSLNSSMNASAQAGWSGGILSLDPANIILGTSGSGAAGNDGDVTFDNNSGTDAYGDLFLNVNKAFAGFSQIILQATGNIYVGNGTVNSIGVFTLSSGITWNLSSSTEQDSGQLTLEAGDNITFGTNAKITDANEWSVTLEAGYDFVNNMVQPGVENLSGNISLTGGTSNTPSNPIQLYAGSLILLAGNNITVGNGSVFTTGGGGIFADALTGDLHAGTGNGGYVYYAGGVVSIPAPGGIATAAGGNVTLIAGDDITSVPTVPQTLPANQSVGASGAYGSGNVTLIAGNQITGNYTLADGAGTMLAGVQVQSGQAAVLQNPTANPAAYQSTLTELEAAASQTQNPNGNIGTALAAVNLSLIEGSWNVTAANNINLGEVRNPNGTFNGNSLAVPDGQFSGNEDNPVIPTSIPFLFNYAADAAV